jgi:hypothetical protein
MTIVNWMVATVKMRFRWFAFVVLKDQRETNEVCEITNASLIAKNNLNVIFRLLLTVSFIY